MLRIFVKSLRHRWYEYLLGALIIALPVAALTAYRSLSAVSDSRVHELAHELGKNMLVVAKSTDLSEHYQLRHGPPRLSDSYPARIQASDLRSHIGVIEARLYGTVDIQGQSTLLVGEQTYRRGAASSSAQEGFAVIGPYAARRLSIKDGSLQIGGESMRVRVAQGEQGDELDDAVVVSLGQAQRILGQPGMIHSMRLAGCWCRIDVPTLGNQVEALLPGTRATTLTSMLEAQKGTVTTVKRYGSLLHGIAVLIIGAIAVGVVASQVKRQNREIGLFLAVGAEPWLIVGAFLFRAAAMAGGGALLGYGLGFPLTSFVAARWMGFSVPVATGSLGMVVLLSLGASIVAALLPSAAAARLDPTHVLREV